MAVFSVLVLRNARRHGRLPGARLEGRSCSWPVQAPTSPTGTCRDESGVRCARSSREVPPAGHIAAAVGRSSSIGAAGSVWWKELVRVSGLAEAASLVFVFFYSASIPQRDDSFLSFHIYLHPPMITH
ncbi:hypothetical protein BS78_01G110500 [Paspalum vaginatum]|nr:hypothetical protein BS78_01G110500 [Paspalum vaginatum]